MGLFGFGKPKMKNPQEFYKDCLDDFHKALGKKGYAKKGLTFIPELMPIGQELILDYFRDESLQSHFDDASAYYYFLCELSFMAGVVIADKWHRDFAALQSGFVDTLYEESPIELAQSVLLQTLNLDYDGQQDKLIMPLYEHWSIMHKPYWDLADPRDYTFRATLAVYHAGISTILQAYGL